MHNYGDSGLEAAMVGFQLRFCHALLFLLIVRSYESRTSYKIITYQRDVLPCWHELL